MATLNTDSTSILHRIQCSDPSLTKLELVKPPSDYYVDFGDFVLALQNNSSIKHVVLHGGYLRELTDEEYTELLHAVTSIRNLLELEFQNTHVPLASVCRAVSNHHSIQKLDIEHGRLYELSDCSALTEHPSLKSIRLKNVRCATGPRGRDAHVPRGLDYLLTALSTCPALESVVVIDWSIGQRAPARENIFCSLADSPSLKSLVLSDLNLTSADLRVFFNNLRQPSSALQVLDLDENFLQDLTALNQAVSEHQNLKTLSLSRNRLTATSCIGLVSAITRNRWSSLEKLSLNDNRMGDGVAESLALLLRTTNLKHLELVGNNLTDRSAVPMAQALETNTVLEKLDLRYNYEISGEGHVALAIALTRDRTFNRIDLKSNRGSLTVVGACAELDMFRNNYVIDDIIAKLSFIGTREIPRIGNQAVSEHQSLKTLSLSCSNLSATRCVGLVAAISRNRWSSLEKLNLHSDNLGDEIVDSLMLLLKTTSLRHLELYRSNLTDRGCVPLAQSLETNSFLETLTLHSNTMSDETYLALASALSHNRSLKFIDLYTEHLLLTVVGAKAMLEMSENNYVIETISTGLSSEGTGELHRIVKQIGRFLSLNRAGRSHLLVGQASRQDWLDAIVKLRDDLDAVHYLVRANPFLCDRYKCDSLLTSSVRKRKALPDVD